jgi:hypothetical protein
MWSRFVTLAALVLPLVALGACDIDLGGPGPAVDITFVPDDGTLEGPGVQLISFELFEDGGVGVETRNLDGVASVSYELAWDPAIASFADIRALPLGGLPDQSTITAELVGGSQGRLRVRHERLPGATEAMGGVLHVLTFQPCDACAGESGVFVGDLRIVDVAGNERPAEARNGRLVVTRLR